VGDREGAVWPEKKSKALKYGMRGLIQNTTERNREKR